MASSPITIAGQAKVPAGPAPRVGQHTVAVLRETGFDEAEITRLLKAGAIVQA